MTAMALKVRKCSVQKNFIIMCNCGSHTFFGIVTCEVSSYSCKNEKEEIPLVLVTHVLQADLTCLKLVSGIQDWMLLKWLSLKLLHQDWMFFLGLSPLHLNKIKTKNNKNLKLPSHSFYNRMRHVDLQLGIST